MTPAKPIKGIIGACLTPFDENDRVDYKALEKEIEFLVPDCDAVTIAAVEAAEYTMLTWNERQEVLKVATEMVAKRVPVILGCSSPSPREVIELAEYSAKVGGDLVQVLMPLRPWGGQPTIAELMEFYTQVASASPLPVTCYHNPGPGADPPQDAFVKISEIDNIRYFKESSRDITKISRLIEQIDIAGRGYYFTTMQPLLVTLMLGGSGATMPPPASRHLGQGIWRPRGFGPVAMRSFLGSGPLTDCHR
jgi:4-hydroxy-tetrahydrodipicolinate synthase